MNNSVSHTGGVFDDSYFCQTSIAQPEVNITTRTGNGVVTDDGEDQLDNGRQGSASRTAFSKAQLEGLEQRFVEQSFLTREERIELGEQLEMTERQVMIWFQNRRGRLKRKGPADKAYAKKQIKRSFGLDTRGRSLLNSVNMTSLMPAAAQPAVSLATTSRDNSASSEWAEPVPVYSHSLHQSGQPGIALSTNDCNVALGDVTGFLGNASSYSPPDGGPQPADMEPSWPVKSTGCHYHDRRYLANTTEPRCHTVRNGWGGQGQGQGRVQVYRLPSPVTCVPDTYSSLSPAMNAAGYPCDQRRLMASSSFTTTMVAAATANVWNRYGNTSEPTGGRVVAGSTAATWTRRETWPNAFGKYEQCSPRGHWQRCQRPSAEDDRRSSTEVTCYGNRFAVTTSWSHDSSVARQSNMGQVTASGRRSVTELSRLADQDRNCWLDARYREDVYDAAGQHAEQTDSSRDDIGVMLDSAAEDDWLLRITDDCSTY